MILLRIVYLFAIYVSENIYIYFPNISSSNNFTVNQLSYEVSSSTLV
jgi:hypothetical protein